MSVNGQDPSVTPRNKSHPGATTSFSIFFLVFSTHVSLPWSSSRTCSLSLPAVAGPTSTICPSSGFSARLLVAAGPPTLWSPALVPFPRARASRGRRARERPARPAAVSGAEHLRSSASPRAVLLKPSRPFLSQFFFLFLCLLFTFSVSSPWLVFTPVPSPSPRVLGGKASRAPSSETTSCPPRASSTHLQHLFAASGPVTASGTDALGSGGAATPLELTGMGQEPQSTQGPAVRPRSGPVRGLPLRDCPQRGQLSSASH